MIQNSTFILAARKLDKVHYGMSVIFPNKLVNKNNTQSNYTIVNFIRGDFVLILGIKFSHRIDECKYFMHFRSKTMM